MRAHPRLVAVAAAVGLLATATVATAAGDARHVTCPHRTLVLSAMPVELGPLLARTSAVHTVKAGDRTFYLGRLRGRDVALGLTGIGPVNATRVTKTALKRLRCGNHGMVDSIVFSGVSGGDAIGNVLVPDSWTLDRGKHVLPVDAGMFATARRVARTHVPLERTAPAGDPACGCLTSPDAVTTVAVTTKPHIEVGGTGQTTDPFSGRALPCVPGGGDVFGCEPCVVQLDAGRDAGGFAPGVVPFVDSAFFTDYGESTKQGKGYVAQDEETAAVATVAAARGVPFLGFRAVSDGAGDPLGLPGFPVQFFFYRQLAADNAAIATMAFLAALS